MNRLNLEGMEREWKIIVITKYEHNAFRSTVIHEEC